MIDPDCWFRIARAAGWITLKWPFRLVVMTSSHSTSVMSKMVAGRRIPAAHTTVSTRPKVSSAHSTTARPPAMVATESKQATASPPALTMPATTSSAGPFDGTEPSTSTPRSLATTFAPAAAIATAIARPIPRPAPVTTDTVPARACEPSSCVASTPGTTSLSYDRLGGFGRSGVCAEIGGRDVGHTGLQVPGLAGQGRPPAGHHDGPVGDAQDLGDELLDEHDPDVALARNCLHRLEQPVHQDGGETG